MRVVLNADGTAEGDTARDWCLQHLGDRDTVVAVAGGSLIGEFVQELPPLDTVGREWDVHRVVEERYCEPLRRAGIDCEAAIVPHHPLRAILDVAKERDADVIVVGKRPHGWLADTLAGETAVHLVHHPPCAVVVVPTEVAAEQH